MNAQWNCHYDIFLRLVKLNTNATALFHLSVIIDILLTFLSAAINAESNVTAFTASWLSDVVSGIKQQAWWNVMKKILKQEPKLLKNYLSKWRSLILQFMSSFKSLFRAWPSF